MGNKGGCATTEDGTMFTLNRMHGNDVHVIAHRGGCWAWKHRQLMSNPKEDVADPVTRTDYKDPDMVGWYEE